MKPFVLQSLLTFFIAAPVMAQVEWLSPTDIHSGERGYALVIVESIDAEGGRISASFDESDFGVTVNVREGTLFRGFSDDLNVEVRGSAGLADLLPGDRVRIFGTGASTGVIQAEDVRLSGRTVAAAAAAGRPGMLEGTVRSVSRNENGFTIETDDRRIWSVLGTASTPVMYRGRSYAIGNLESGDGVRVTVASWDGDTPVAERVDVLRDARAPGEALTSVSGRISAVRSSDSMITLETARGEFVQVDLTGATDEAGRELRTSELRLGRSVEVSGRSAMDGSFRAAVVRFGEGEAGEAAAPVRFSPVVVRGVVREPMSDEGWIVIDEGGGASAEVLLDPDQPVRFRPGRWLRADELQAGDRLRIRAIDTGGGVLIGQVIEVENFRD